MKVPSGIRTHDLMMNSACALPLFYNCCPYKVLRGASGSRVQLKHMWTKIVSVFSISKKLFRGCHVTLSTQKGAKNRLVVDWVSKSETQVRRSINAPAWDWNRKPKQTTCYTAVADSVTWLGEILPVGQIYKITWASFYLGCFSEWGNLQ